MNKRIALFLVTALLFTVVSCDLFFGNHIHSFDSTTQKCECGVIRDDVVAYIGTSFDNAIARFLALQDAVDYLASQQSSSLDARSVSEENTIHGYGSNIACTGITINNTEVAFDFSESIVTFTGTQGIVINGGIVEISGQEIKGSDDTISLITVNTGSVTTAIDFEGSITVNSDASLTIEQGNVYIREFKSDNTESKNVILASSSVSLSTEAFTAINEHINEDSTSTPDVFDKEDNQVVLHKESFNSKGNKIWAIDYYEDGKTIKTNTHYYTNGVIDYIESFDESGELISKIYNMQHIINIFIYDGGPGMNLLSSNVNSVSYTDGMGFIIKFEIDEHGCPTIMSSGNTQEGTLISYPSDYPYNIQWKVEYEEEDDQIYTMHVSEDCSITTKCNNNPYFEAQTDQDGNITQVTFAEGHKYEIEYSDGKKTSIKETYEDEHMDEDTIIRYCEYNTDGLLIKETDVHYKTGQIIETDVFTYTYTNNNKTVLFEWIQDESFVDRIVYVIADDGSLISETPLLDY